MDVHLKSVHESLHMQAVKMSRIRCDVPFFLLQVRLGSLHKHKKVFFFFCSTNLAREAVHRVSLCTFTHVALCLLGFFHLISQSTLPSQFNRLRYRAALLRFFCLRLSLISPRAVTSFLMFSGSRSPLTGSVQCDGQS